MKIGVIGSNGFIGSNLYNYFLKKKIKIVKFSSFKKNKNNWINKVSNEIRFFKPDIIINCAASQILNDDKKSIINLLNSNLYSNIHFLKEATNYRSFKGFITFGTKWEFDQNRNFKPLNFYAATKHANDTFLKYFSLKNNITTISLKSYFFATFFGIMPGTVLYVWLGNTIDALLSKGEWPNMLDLIDSRIWMPVASLGLLIFVTAIFRLLRTKIN